MASSAQSRVIVSVGWSTVTSRDHPTGKGEAVQIGLDGERIVLHGDGSDHANLRFYREGFLVVERLKKAR
jgi:hypothetical protein